MPRVTITYSLAAPTATMLAKPEFKPTRVEPTIQYRICGPVREIYIRPAEQTSGVASQSDPNTVTEIQFPVEKV